MTTKKTRLQKRFFKHYGQGFSTLFIVIILGFLSMSLVLMISTNSFLAVKGSIDVKNANQAKSSMNACAEIVLEIIRENNNYIGSNNVTLGNNICNYIIVDTGGMNRSISISSTVNGVTRKLQINTMAFNPLQISLWQEVQ